MDSVKHINPKYSIFCLLLVTILCFSQLINSPIAILIGFLFSYFFGHPFKELNHKIVNLLLKIAVIGFGFATNIEEAFAAGKDSFLLTVSFILAVMLIGYLIGRYLNINQKLSYLISSGTAICGGSAIAAVSPSIHAKEKEISVSLAVIFLLNSLALLLFPPIGELLNLSQKQFGLWAAIAIHDTSSVVGAASVFGDEALRIATTVKLSRALWIIPLSLFSIMLFKAKKTKISIPWFIFLFIVAALINSYTSLSFMISNSIVIGAKSLLILTLFFVGAGLSIENLKTIGFKPLSLGVVLWIIVSVSSLFTILTLY